MKKVNYETNSAYRLMSKLFGKEKAKDLMDKANYLDAHNVDGFTFLTVANDTTLEYLKTHTIVKKREYSQETLEKRYEKALAKLNAKFNK